MTEAVLEEVDPGQATLDGEPAAEAKPKRRPRKQPATRTRGVELILTVTDAGEGTDWRAELSHGGETVVSELPIPASAISAAAKDLHPEIADTIEGVLRTAREQHRSRVEALQAQLEAARQALAELDV
jgi:hypothetical protein